MKHEWPIVEADSQIATILRNALDLLEWRGWCQHSLFEDGRYCSRGAIVMVTQDKYLRAGAYDALHEAIGRQPITMWNDAPDRTFDEIRAGFLKAIAAN